MQIVDVSRLKEGMTLAAPVYCNYSYKVLLPKGTTLNSTHLEKLNKFKAKGYCIIQDSNNSDEINMDILEKVSNTKVRETFLNTYLAGKNLYEDVAQGKYIDINQAREAANDLTEQLTCNSNLLAQLATIKIVDEYSFSHMINVAIYAGCFARALNFTHDQVKDICLAGLLHDIGKAKIPQSILKKPGKLTEEEFKIIKKHPEYGYEELIEIQEINEDIQQGVLQHHERINGEGYPYGLKEKEINLISRIISIVDVYDALTSNRCYRKGLLPHEAAETLMGGSSINDFDLELTRIFVKSITLYPIGTEVMLNTGQQAKVIEVPQSFPLRPKIEIIEPGNMISDRPSPKLDLLKERTVFITKIIA